MNLKFVKMQAQGNDFVILNSMVDALPDMSTSLVQKICDRHLGIGCDQLLVLKTHATADALLLIYNADGSQATNCGNGLRCVGDLLMRQLTKDTVSIALADRVVQAKRTDLGVQVMMGQAIIEHIAQDYMDIDMGNPHRVYFENAQPCPERNVEIITEYNEEKAVIHITERGAGETLACGSGACATAVAVWQKLNTNKPDKTTPLIIVMPGGEVHVSMFSGNLYLEGEVNFIFEGQYSIERPQV